MNGTNDKQRQIQDSFSSGGGSAVKAVTKVEHQHHVPRYYKYLSTPPSEARASNF